MLGIHFTILHIIAYLAVPLLQIVYGSPENFESFIWICLLWTFLLQFHLWHIWFRYGRLFIEEGLSYAKYICIVSHFGCHIGFHLMFMIVHNIFHAGLLGLTVSTLIVDYLIMTFATVCDPTYISRAGRH